MNAQEQAAIEAISAISSAIKALGCVPSGHLYARVMAHMDIHRYNAIIGALKRAKLVEEKNYELTWVGPK